MDNSSIMRRPPVDKEDRTRVRAPIDAFFTASSQADGVDIRRLSAGDELLVHTCYSTYRLQVEDPRAARVQASSDGKVLTEPVPCGVLGATLSGRGSMLRMGWALVGYKIVLRLPDGELMTSKVRALTLNGYPIVTADDAVH